LTADGKRTDWVAPPIVSWTRSADRCEGSDEERPGKDTAEKLTLV
jgi:hypothetical protein